MGVHENKGLSDEWYTPKYVFDALDVSFDLDVAHPINKTFVPTDNYFTSNSLTSEWFGFVWMNPPWCSTKDKVKWIEKFVNHANGIALLPDSTSAKWWQYLSKNSDAVLFVEGRVKFIKADGSTGDNPANGTTLFAIGEKAAKSLKNAEMKGLGICYSKNKTTEIEV